MDAVVDWLKQLVELGIQHKALLEALAAVLALATALLLTLTGWRGDCDGATAVAGGAIPGSAIHPSPTAA